MVDILVHSCCGPCLLSIVGWLRETGYNVIPYWFNPNVMPYREYQARLSAFVEVCEQLNLEPVIDDEYDVEHILHQVLIPVNKRCPACYRYRLEKTAAKATFLGIGLYSTTLLQSRYQDHLAIAEIGGRVGEKEGVEFLYEDFRHLYEKGKKLTVESGIYRQKYCGCIYSEEERYRKK